MGSSRRVRSIVRLDSSQQLLDHLRRIDSHEPAKRPTPLPPNDALRGIPQSLSAVQANPHVPIRLHARDASDIALNVGVGQMRE
jgi:hypothetical protein